MIIIFFQFLIITLLIIKYSNKILVNNFKSLHNIHEGIVPRIGGLPMFLSYNLILIFYLGDMKLDTYIYMITGLLIFLVGFIEDILQSVKHVFRLALLLVITFVYFFLIQDSLPKIDIFFIDILFERFTLLKILFYSIGLVGFINGSNMTDGSNGLFAISNIIIGISIMILLSNFGINIVHNEIFYLIIFLALFLLFNFPSGKIFIGDGGAYYVAFIIGVLVIKIFHINDFINSWYAIIILIYPLLELLFSIIRKMIFGISPLNADRGHLHILIFTYLNKKYDKKISNNLVVFYMLPIISLPIINLLILNNYEINLFVVISFSIFIYFFYYLFFHYLNSSSK
jgi:UDP-N-acetylmuramyl pentapeptide phosphotransferase/UDP-N-acetylglucosamine-1-phosphate transferase